jgi:hypothetical protein
MSRPLDDQWEIWGLTGAVCGTTVHLPTPDAQLGRGLGSAMISSLSELLGCGFQKAEFYHARFSAFEQVGLLVQVLANNPRVLKVSSADGSEVHVLRPVHKDARSEAVSDPDWHLDRDDPGTVFLQCSGEARAVVGTQARSGILIEADGQSVTQLFLPLDPEPCAPMSSPALRWCEELGDSWLREEVVEALADADPLGHVVAVGLFKRMQADPADPVGTVRQLLEGKPVPQLSRSHEWFRSLSAAQRRTSERLACERSERLAAQMPLLSRLTAEQVLSVLVKRDDLEGVRVLLQEVGAGQRLDAAVSAVDRFGCECQDRSLAHTAVRCQRLVRAYQLDPGAWWATALGAGPS